VLSKKIQPKKIKPSSLLSLEEMQCQMGEARTNQRVNAKQPSVSGDVMIRPLLWLLSKEMQHQMGVDKTNRRNNAKQPSVSGEKMLCQIREARTNWRNNAKQLSVSGGYAKSDGRSQNYPKKWCQAAFCLWRWGSFGCICNPISSGGSGLPAALFAVQGNATSDGRSQNYPRKWCQAAFFLWSPRKCNIRWEKPELSKEMMPSSLLSLKEMQHQMGEARTIQRNDAKQPSISGGNATSDGRSQNYPKKWCQAAFRLWRKFNIRWEKPEPSKERMLSSLLSLEEMQHQMGEARTIQRNDAKQPSVSGAFCLWRGHNKLETKNDVKCRAFSGKPFKSQTY
jgi:hypothetical protein